MSSLAERLYRITKRHPLFNSKAKLADHLGLSRSMLYNYENGNPPAPREFLDKLTALEITLDIPDAGFSSTVQEDTPVYGGGARRIPVIGWAHAGQASTYEEMAHDWRRYIASDCRDPKAFAVTLEGDSMEPYFREGDELILMPGEEAHSGCYAVCRFNDDGVVFRRIELMGDIIRLVPLNPRYEPCNYNRSEFSWIYPTWERRSQLWK